MTFVLVFLASGAVVILAAVALARHADHIAEQTGIGRLWIGSVLLAAATSLPEATTDVAAVRMGSVDLAVGDLFGSSMANMLILAMVDLYPPQGRVLRQATFEHALTACLALILTALAAVFVLVRLRLELLGTSMGAFLLLLTYVAGMRAVYLNTIRSDPAGSPPSADSSKASSSNHGVRRSVLWFLASAGIVLLAAPWFAWASKGIAEISGLGPTFVGTLMVGLSTSLPELVASIAAVRMGSFDLAVGNLFGSNACNMAIFLLLDLAHPGSIFAAVNQGHVIAALFSLVLMGLGLAAIVYRAERRYAFLEPDSWLMTAVYVLGIGVLYFYGGAG